MVNTITFPNLGWSFEINRVAFSLFGIDFYWYGVLIGLGVLLALIYAERTSETFGLNYDDMIDVLFGGIVIGIIGARLYYVVFSWDSYKNDLSSIFDVRSGGLAIYGGIIFGFLSGYLLSKWKKVRFLPLADAVSGGFLIGQSIGRWGNFVNVEAFGANTNLPWGMSGDRVVSYLSAHKAELEALGVQVDPNMPVHPTFLYESLWCLTGLIVMQFVIKRRKFDGECLLFYIGWYGAGRMIIEGLRTDSLMLGNSGIRVSQLIAFGAVTAAVGIWLYVRNKIKQNSEKFTLYCETQESKDRISTKKVKEKNS